MAFVGFAEAHTTSFVRCTKPRIYCIALTNLPGGLVDWVTNTLTWIANSSDLQACYSAYRFHVFAEVSRTIMLMSGEL
jgi:hypothetical protein